MDSDTNKFGKDAEEENKKRRDVLRRQTGNAFVFAFALLALLQSISIFVPVTASEWPIRILFYALWASWILSWILSMPLIDYYCGFIRCRTALAFALLAAVLFVWLLLISFNIALW